MSFLKKLSSHFPFFKDQGMDYVTAASAPTAIQSVTVAASSTPEAHTFEALGLSNMASTDYQVLVQNNTDAGDEALVSAKSELGFTITGPDAADSLDIVIIGALAGQVTA